MKDHILICGFGSTGQSAAEELIQRGTPPSEIAAVDTDPAAVDIANRLGIVAVHGDATRNDVLAQAAADGAATILVTPGRDDTAVLITLTAREINTRARIVAGGRERENLHLLRQGGADEVIDETAAVGRMIGLAAKSPSAGRVLDDLIDGGRGLELVEISPDHTDGTAVAPDGTMLVAVIRGGTRLPHAAIDGPLQRDDRLIVLRHCDEVT